MKTKLKNTAEAFYVAVFSVIMFLLGIVISGVGIDIIEIMFNF